MDDHTLEAITMRRPPAPKPDPIPYYLRQCPEYMRFLASVSARPEV